jgi:hypothetical protein
MSQDYKARTSREGGGRKKEGEGRQGEGPAGALSMTGSAHSGSGNLTM